MSLLEELQQLAADHEKCAAVYAARLDEAQHSGLPARDYAKRLDRHQRAIETCQRAIKAVSTREKRGAFIPPTLRELLAFARELGWPEDNARGWFDHFESNGWRVSGKSVMVDWQAGARNGFRRWQERNLKAPASSANDDPAGWVEYLTAHPEQRRECKRPEYRYAPERVQRAFLQSRRSTK